MSGCTKSDSKGAGMAESSHTKPQKKMSTKSEGTNSVSKAAGMAESSQTKPYLFLNELEVDVTGMIVMMIGRVWDVNVVTGRYLRTNLVVSDSRETTVWKVFVNGHGFLKYLFHLIDFDRIEPANNKYLIDVTSYVTDVGRTNYTKTGSKNLDFYLVNQRQCTRSNGSFMVWKSVGYDRIESSGYGVLIFNLMWSLILYRVDGGDFYEICDDLRFIVINNPFWKDSHVASFEQDFVLNSRLEVSDTTLQDLQIQKNSPPIFVDISSRGSSHEFLRGSKGVLISFINFSAVYPSFVGLLISEFGMFCYIGAWYDGVRLPVQVVGGWMGWLVWGSRGCRGLGLRVGGREGGGGGVGGIGILECVDWVGACGVLWGCWFCGYSLWDCGEVSWLSGGENGGIQGRMRDGCGCRRNEGGGGEGVVGWKRMRWRTEGGEGGGKREGGGDRCRVWWLFVIVGVMGSLLKGKVWWFQLVAWFAVLGEVVRMGLDLLLKERSYKKLAQKINYFQVSIQDNSIRRIQWKWICRINQLGLNTLYLDRRTGYRHLDWRGLGLVKSHSSYDTGRSIRKIRCELRAKKEIRKLECQ
ncbi:hypothetical protein Tco_0087868 [Tanacetum coccineum]